MQKRPLGITAVIASAAISVLSLPSAWAATETWVGNTDTDFATGANWDTTTAPLSGDSLVFGLAGTSGATLTDTLTSSAFNIGGITFTSAATTAYSIGGNDFTLTGNISSASTVTHTISNNIVIATGAHTVALTGASANAGIILSGNLTGGGTISQTGGGTVTRLTLSGNNSGFTGSFSNDNTASTRTSFASAASGSASAAWTFNKVVNGGTSLGFSNATINFGSLAGGGNLRADVNGTATVSVGALNTDTTFSGILQQGNASQIMALSKVGTGTLALSGTANVHAGGTTINNGKLAITNATGNSLGAGTVNVSGGASATLGGTGIATAATTVTNGSRLAAGTITTASNFGSAGTLTLATLTTATQLTLTNANLDFDLATTAAGTSDKIVAGSLTFGSTVAFSFTGLGATLETGVAYTLINGADAGTVTGFSAGNFSTNFLGALSGNYTVVYSVNGTNDLLVTFAAIPEPSTWWMVFGGLGLFVGFQRVRRLRV